MEYFIILVPLLTAAAVVLAVARRKDVFVVPAEQPSAIERLRAIGFDLDGPYYPAPIGTLIKKCVWLPCAKCGCFSRCRLGEKSVCEEPSYAIDFCNRPDCGHVHGETYPCGWLSLRLHRRKNVFEGIVAVEKELRWLLEEQETQHILLETAERDLRAAQDRLMELSVTPYGKMPSSLEPSFAYLCAWERERFAHQQIAHLRKVMREIRWRLPPTFRGREALMTETPAASERSVP